MEMDFETSYRYQDRAYDFESSQTVSNFTVQFVIFCYGLATLLSLAIDTSSFYDVIGLLSVFIVMCALIPFSGHNSFSIAHIAIILLWSFIQIILASIYWKTKDRRFVDHGSSSSAINRLLLYIGQGIQVTLITRLTIVMIRKSSQTGRQRHRQILLVTLTGWILAIIGLIVSSVYFKQLKTKDTNDRNWHYVGEMLFWFGLNLSAFITLAATNFTSYLLLVVGPLCFMIPCLLFDE